ncbi:Alpha/Beta hydrolase protein [Russula earlei]|uniref:Alpha/Beta hydrolase protein n=1 Tax=Russula earlei TaxID=71964 RepID=A0ACC0UEY3_9AGAM|nr:Alpha/Beta hydrolase protein [Russula earlei]
MATKTPLIATFLQTARNFLLTLGCVYVVLLALGTRPYFQRQLLYMNNLRLPLFARYEMPEKYDLAPFKTRDVRIHTADNETLGAWFTFADPFYVARKADLLSPSTSADESIRSALRAHPTILFLHGNGGTRAVAPRVRHYQAFAARLRANILAPDYRGFGDSTGAPSEVGLVLDARASWDWLRSHGAPPESILVVGNSLGTAVGVQLVSALEAEALGGNEQYRKEGEPHEIPRGLVLLAPFSNVETLLDTYYVAGLVPLLAPLRIFPYIGSFIKSFLVHRFDTLTRVVVGLKLPLLIVHAENDWDIPHSHSQTLFDAFLEEHLPPLPDFTEVMAGASDEAAERIARLSQEWRALRQELVTTSDIARVGHVEVFSKDRSHGKVVFLRTLWGGHANLGLVEGVQDYMAEMFKMG